MGIRPGKIFFCLFLVSTSLYGTPVHDALSIPIGGIVQWITIDGTDDRNPLLLFLHGGPGGSALSYSDKFTGELRKHFVVVQWDQRNTGKTASGLPSVLLTVALFESDAVAVIVYLQNRFHQSQVYLAGHSWGGFLALKIAADHPDLLAACFAAAPMIWQEESEKIALEKMKEIAVREGNRQAQTELATVKIPFETGIQVYFHRKWLYLLINGQKPPFGKDYVMNWAKTWLNLFDEASAFDFFKNVPEVRCPVYFLVGSRDYQTNFKLTESYFQQLKAEKKELFWFTNPAHGLVTSESKKFQEVIIQILKRK